MVFRENLDLESIEFIDKREEKDEPQIIQTDIPAQKAQKPKMSLYLLICCLVVCSGSFQFGYNLSSLNPCTELVKSFIQLNSFIFADIRARQDLNQTVTDQKTDQEMNRLSEIYWALINGVYVIGGMMGALTSKFIIGRLGRKKSIIYHNCFGILGAILTLVASYTRVPEILVFARFLSGYQGGISMCVTPIYLNEIAPIALRGQVGCFPQLGVTFGVISAQTLAFRQFLGTTNGWQFVLAGSMIPAILGLLIAYFIPESPVELIKKDQSKARQALCKLRSSKNVDHELEELNNLVNAQSQLKAVSLTEVFTSKEMRWPLIICFFLTLSQHLSGVNAIFLYSAEIFKAAKIPSHLMQYAILSTGIVIFLTSLICLFLVERLGRRILFIASTSVIIVDFVLLTLCLSYKDSHSALSYLSVVCILIHLTCFSLGLASIPPMYATECFRPNVRTTVMASVSLVNWLNSFLWALAFPILNQIIQQYVFLIFSVLLTPVLILVSLKMVESKGKTTTEIIAEYNKIK